LIVVGLGISAPVIVVTLGWRWIYFITSALAFVAWFGLIFLVPETRWKRSQAELGMSLLFLGLC
jgi:predicted MFS family arabinose efflux permease